MQLVVADAKASAGQVPAPSQNSATSHEPAAARQSVVVGSLFAWQNPKLLHVSGLSHAVSEELPQEFPVAAVCRHALMLVSQR